MAFSLELFSLTFATGLLVCLGFVLLANALLQKRGFELLSDYKPPEVFFAAALAISFVVGFLAEDTFDSSTLDFFDRLEETFWEPADANAFNKAEKDPPPDQPFEIFNNAADPLTLASYFIPEPKEKIRFASLFGNDALKGEAQMTIHWHPFAEYYKNFELFSKFTRPHAIYKAFQSAIEKNHRVSSKTCMKGAQSGLDINGQCYTRDEVKRYVNHLVSQTYYHSKNLIFLNKNYFDELTTRERRVNFSRAITYIALIFFVLCGFVFGIMMIIWAIRYTLTPFKAEKHERPSLLKASYLTVPMISFGLLAFLAKSAYEFELDQVNKRVFGYTTSLGLAAKNSEREKAFERYFLGIDPGQDRNF